MPLTGPELIFSASVIILSLFLYKLSFMKTKKSSLPGKSVTVHNKIVYIWTDTLNFIWKNLVPDQERNVHKLIVNFQQQMLNDQTIVPCSSP